MKSQIDAGGGRGRLPQPVALSRTRAGFVPRALCALLFGLPSLDVAAEETDRKSQGRYDEGRVFNGAVFNDGDHFIRFGIFNSAADRAAIEQEGTASLTLKGGLVQQQLSDSLYGADNRKPGLARRSAATGSLKADGAMFHTAGTLSHGIFLQGGDIARNRFSDISVVTGGEGANAVRLENASAYVGGEESRFRTQGALAPAVSLQNGELVLRNVTAVAEKSDAVNLMQAAGGETRLVLEGETRISSGTGVLARVAAAAGAARPVELLLREQARASGGLDALRLPGAGGPASIRVTMRDDAQWTGSVQTRAMSVAVELGDRARWTVKENSTIASLDMQGGGVVAFPRHQEPGVLHVDGDLQGSGGVFEMNVDTAAGTADKVVVKGKVKGDHGLLVRNTGKQATVEEVPALIEAGTRGAGTFTLLNKDRVVEAGVYQYALHRVANGPTGLAWQLVQAGEAPQPAPEPESRAEPRTGSETESGPGPGPEIEAVSQPEPAPVPLSGIESYPAPRPVKPRLSTQARAVVNTAALGTAFHLWNTERTLMASRLDDIGRDGTQTGVWMRSIGTRQQLDNGIGGAFSQKLGGMRLGGDRTIRTREGRWVTGAFGGYTRADRDLRGGSKGSTDSYQGGVYGAYIADQGAYASIGMTYSRSNNTYRSLGTDGHASRGAYANNAIGLAMDAGRRFGFEHGWFLEPRMGVDYFHLGSARFRSNDGMSVRVGSGDVAQGRASLMLGREIALNRGSLTPYARLGVAKAWSRHGDVVANGIALRPGAGGARVEVGGGMTADVARRHSLYVDYRHTRGQGYRQPVAVEFGYRYQF